MLTSVWTSLSGIKTYIVVAAYLTLVVMEKFAGIDVPNFSVPADWVAPVLSALGVATFRDALSKIGY